MLTDIFYWILNMSIAATVSGLIILLLRRIRRIPGSAVYILWAIPLIRLWMPFGFGYKYSMMSLIDKVAVKTVTIYSEEAIPDFSATNFLGAADQYFPITYKTNILEKIFRIGSVVWIVLAVSFILTAVALYVITKSGNRDARHLRDNVYVSDKLLSPAVFGVFRPRIILPQYLRDEKTAYILMHEEVHIRRCDNLWRMIAVITCCLHWFNPFVWLFLKCFFEDMELSCDEHVLRKCGEVRKKDYANALIECEARKMVFVSAFGGAKTRVRIEKILSYKKLSIFSTVCFAALIIAAAVTLLTNAAG